VVALLVTASATVYLLTERFFRMMIPGLGLAAAVLVSTCLFFLVLASRRLWRTGRLRT